MRTWWHADMGNKLMGNILPIVNMTTVRLILLIYRIYNLDSKAIDFVLAFPQADLDVDMWMYLPSGFQMAQLTKNILKNIY